MGNTNSGAERKRSGSKDSQGSIQQATSTNHSPSKDAQPAIRGMTRSPSGADIKDTQANFLPVEKLAKLLVKKTEQEYGVSGILSDVFVKYVFPKYPNLGHRLFNYFYINSHAKTKHLGGVAFRQQAERFLGILDDQVILEAYVKMFSDTETDLCTAEGLKSLLMTCFNLAMAHYDSQNGTKVCNMVDRTLKAVMTSCFFQEPLSTGFVSRWLDQNCPRLVPPVHRFTVHALSTVYRSLEMEDHEKNGCGLELATPVLEKMSPFDENHPPLLPISVAWLLAGTLPSIYSRPQSAGQSPKADPANGQAAGPSTVLASQSFMAKLLSVVPSHWSLLYDSQQDGLGSNRFLHHVLGYRGPTLILIQARDLNAVDLVYCIAAPSEWRETHLYSGGEDSCLIQLQPKFSLLEKGAKILYLNTTIRGYPKGVRVAVDPRNPIIAIDEAFEKLEVHSIGHQLINIEVWGCGDTKILDTQQDIKKWQVKEAERQRTVKLSTADWIDHPDRYLLELGGRTQYNNSAN